MKAGWCGEMTVGPIFDQVRRLPACLANIQRILLPHHCECAPCIPKEHNTHNRGGAKEI